MKKILFYIFFYIISTNYYNFIMSNKEQEERIPVDDVHPLLLCYVLKRKKFHFLHINNKLHVESLDYWLDRLKYDNVTLDYRDNTEETKYNRKTLQAVIDRIHNNQDKVVAFAYNIDNNTNVAKL